MSYNKHIQRPIGGMDFDSDDRDVEIIDYRKAINIRNTTAYIEKGESSTNVKGNIEVSFDLPSGENKCIGAYNDRQNRTCIYMIWNSNFNHGIYRFYPDKKDALNPNGTIEHIITYNFGWIKDRYITGIDLVNNELLYWTDNVKPRKVNINKANLTNKRKCWNLYIPKLDWEVYKLNFPSLVVKDQSGSTIINTGFGGANNLNINTREKLINYIVDGINNSFSGIIKADSCKGYIEICEVDSGAVSDIELTIYYIDTSDNNNTIVININATPSNWYGNNLIDRFFDRAKYPPGREPLCLFDLNEDVNYNYVKQKVFQFRLQYVYDDAEKSALGPISLIPVNNQSCAGISEANYVNVNFNDENLLDENIWVILKRIRVHVREGNIGNWQLIEDLDISEFYNLLNGQKEASYDFYNDVAKTGIDEFLANKLYDKVPRYSESQKFIENRLVDGGVLDDYDAPCVDADLGIEVAKNQQEKTYDILGIIRIANWQVEDGAEDSYVPWYGDVNSGEGFLGSIRARGGAIVKFPLEDGSYDFPVFGGIYATKKARDSQRLAEQWLPEGGWVAYLSGTDYLGISEQIAVDFLPQGDNNVIDGSIGADNIQSAINTNFYPNDGDLFSYFRIKNVRPGKYILRLASHWCSIGDKLGKGDLYDITKGRGYQKTSTNVLAVHRFINGNFEEHDYFVSEIEVEITNEDVFVGDFVVEDLVNIVEDKTGYSATGYLLDNEANTSIEGIEKAIAIERAMLLFPTHSFDPEGYDYYNNPPQSFGAVNFLTVWTMTWTDHNGYWYIRNLRHVAYGTLFGPSGASAKIAQVTQDNTPYQGMSAIHPDYFSMKTFGVSYFIENENDGVWKNTSNNKALNYGNFPSIENAHKNDCHRQYILLNQSEEFTNNYKTYIEGYVRDSLGNGVSNLLVQYSKVGRNVLTDSNGFYRIPIFADILFPYKTWLQTVIQQSNYSWSLSGGGYWACDTTFDFIHSFDIFENLSTFYPDYTRRNGNIIYNDFSTCQIDYLIGDSLSYSINPFAQNNGLVGPPYSSTAIFKVLDNIVNIVSDAMGQSWKRGGSYLVGLRYQDEAGRMCSVVDLGKAYIPFYGEDLNLYYPNDYPLPETFRQGPARIRVKLNSKPPIWAYNYQILITKNIHHKKSLQYLVNDVQYITDYDDDNQESTQTTYNSGSANQVMINLNNVIDAYNRDNDSQIGYSYEDGDRVRIILNEDGVYFNELIEFKAVSFKEGNWLVLKNNQSFPEIKSGFLVEIFNRRLLNEEQIYYECGTSYKCTNPGQTNNLHSVTDFFIKGGESYFRKRTMKVIDEDDSIFGSFNYIIESLNISDFYPSRDYNLGRIGIVDKDFKEIFRPTTYRVSNNYVPGTDINGLSNNEGLEDIEADREFGLIKRLLRVGNVLLSVHINRTASIYVNERIITDTNGEESLAISNKFLNTIRPLTGNYGTQHPESVVEFENIAFGYDSFRGSVWQYSQAGLEIISENKAINYFKNISKDGIWDSPAVFDPYYREYILTIGQKGISETLEVVDSDINLGVTLLQSTTSTVITETDSLEIDINGEYKKFQVYYVNGNTIGILGVITDLYPKETEVKVYLRGERETIAYSALKNKWTTFYTYEQDYYSSVIKSLLSFKDGKLKVHDIGEVNVFNGVYSPSEIWLIISPEPIHPKVWYANELQQKQLDGNCDWEIYEITNREGQNSRILKNSWVKKQDHWYSEFKRDLNTQIANPILNGERLRSVAILVKMRNNSTKTIDIWAYITNFEISNRTIK